MKLQELEDGATVATKLDLEKLRLEFEALKLQLREFRVEIKEQFQRIKLLIWLPVITGGIQILILIFKR
jgi:hypothetical protein